MNDEFSAVSISSTPEEEEAFKMLEAQAPLYAHQRTFSGPHPQRDKTGDDRRDPQVPNSKSKWGHNIG